MHYINSGIEERSQPNVQFWEDKGNAGPSGWGSQPNGRPPRGSNGEGQRGGGKHQRCLPEDDARRDCQVVHFTRDKINQKQPKYSSI